MVDKTRIKEVIDLAIEKIEAGSNIAHSVQEFTPFDVVNYLQEIGYEAHDLETNGWQVDFWQDFTKDGCKKLTFAGSWYFGQSTLSEACDD
ncbi:hypothetical protein [Vibrio phage XZ1]|uniref:Uncharacterized protein n=2 Tax=Schizotequatrovirus valkk3 TaxID=1914021 RepID=A0A126HH83_9CAUD|nr:hypothetical protein AVU32_gp121 [Vibrio phage ValKK3]AJT60962.1 hypothetical protein [Vibrio phage ValKK3]ALP47233.1 hypothetical protein phiGrn1_0251 [Vibrio phage phi-Grn1]UOL51389.1 hypothetical protein [Vibrio phage XZ1]